MSVSSRFPGRGTWAATALVSLTALTACGPDAPERGTATAREDRGAAEPRLGPYPRSQFYIERDLFIAADEPRCVPAAEATFLEDGDEVFGIVIREKARAYAVTMLSYHHVVNDVVEGIPVAVTY